jgi:hypothetical protein
LGSQLSNLASGLLTGGAIGASFAGFAALLNLINTRHDDQIKLLDELTSSLDKARDNVSVLIDEYKKLTEPSFVENIQFAMLSALGLGAGEIEYRMGQLKKIKETFTALAEEESTVKFRLENQIKINTELRDSATTAEEYTRYQKVINELQDQFNSLSGKTKEIVEEIKTVEEEVLEEKIRGAYGAVKISRKANADILKDYIATQKKIQAADENTKAMKAGMSEEARRSEIENSEATFSALSGVYAQHTAVFKAASAAQALINTYAAAQAALAPPPLGLGPILGPALAALVVAGGLARVASILSTEIPGYAKGGIVVGEKGPEVIAPMDSYAEGQSLLVAKTIAAVNSKLGGTGSSSIENKLDQVILAFNRKQFRIRYDDLYTANDKSSAIISELEF